MIIEKLLIYKLSAIFFASSLGRRIFNIIKLDQPWNRLPLLTSSLVPPQLVKEIEQRNKLRENHLIQEPDYKKINFNLWNKNKFLSPQELPIKLYNIKEKRVEWIHKDFKIKRYSALSYAWGNKKPNQKLSQWGLKSLIKAEKACQLLDIDCLWMDQLCIDQTNSQEKVQEVLKMRQYYSNAEYTLISINTELGNISDIDLIGILKTIVRSEWFSRSWAFQEGWLSKHTIFMFDDYLVDGRAIAGSWALNQLSYVGEGKYNSRAEFNRGTKKIATPVGWTYYRDGYNENDKVEMTLNQALKAIKSRKRSIPVDGIYSILGLLPYGDDKRIIIDYSESNTPEKALKNIMEVATKNGYTDPISWHGVSNAIPGLCWMPQIYEDGSTNVEGEIDIGKTKEGIFVAQKGITLHVAKYIIHESSSEVSKIEGGLEIESGLYQKNVWLKKSGVERLSKWGGGRWTPNNKELPESFKDFERRKEEIIKTSLFGTKKSLNSIQKDDCLLIYRNSFYSGKKSFATLLARNTGKVADNNIHIYHRLGLIELGSPRIILIAEKESLNKETIIIGSNSLASQVASIEIPPK